MRVLISGGAGFIASNLADRLVTDGHTVRGFDNFLTGREQNWPDAELLDITDRRMLYALANEVEPELIIHCAASYKDPDKWHLDTDTNIAGAINIAAVAKHHGARVIYFQTVLPPISSYAISKIAAEHYLRLSGVPLTVFRLAAVYGPRNLSGAVPTFYRQVSECKPCTVVEDATRDFVFIEDLVERVTAEALRNGNLMNPVTGKTFWGQATTDVRTGIETPIRHIPALIGELLDIEPIVNLVPRQEDDVAHYEMNGTPRVGTPFIEGLRKAVEWYEENPVSDTFTHLKIGG